MTPESAMAARSTAPERHVELIRRACAYIDARDGEPVTLAALAGHLEVSPWHLQRLFKKATGVSPRDYADAQRAARFRDNLKRGESIAGATYGAGYGSSSRVYEGARWQLGSCNLPISPSVPERSRATDPPTARHPRRRSRSADGGRWAG